jgi:alpha-1,6-mannosyltransferase
MSVHSPLGATTRSGAFELRSRALGARRASTEARVGMLGLGGLLLTVLLVSISAAHTNLLLPESVRLGLPSWLAGPFGSSGIDLGAGGVISVMVVMFGCYVIAVRFADRLSGRSVLMTIAALNALILLAPPLLSTDVFSYQAYARMWALDGANPYLHGPNVISLDPLYPFIGAKWVSTPTAYGPLFTLLSYGLAPLSIAASALAYKALAAIASICCVALLWNAARLRGLDPVRAVAVVGLNPLVVVYGVGGGHNDLLMLAAVCAGVYAMLQHRERAGGAMIAVAAGIKLTAGLFLPFAIASEIGLGGRRRRRDFLIGAGAALALIVVAGILAFGTGPLHLPATLQKTQNAGDWHSIPGFISTRLGLGDIGHATAIGLGVLFIGLCLWLLRRVAIGAMDWIDGAGWATLAMIVSAGSLLPWYVAWLLPMVALCSDRRLWRAGTVITGVVLGIRLLGYIPHGGSLLGL